MNDAHNRLRLERAAIVRSGDRELVATLNVITDGRLALDVAALSEVAWKALEPGPDAWAVFSHIARTDGRQPVGYGIGPALEACDVLAVLRGAADAPADAPASPVAGIDCRVRIGDTVRAGQPLFQVHAQTPGELNYALEYAGSQSDVFSIGVGT